MSIDLVEVIYDDAGVKYLTCDGDRIARRDDSGWVSLVPDLVVRDGNSKNMVVIEDRRRLDPKLLRKGHKHNLSPERLEHSKPYCHLKTVRVPTVPNSETGQSIC